MRERQVFHSGLFTALAIAGAGASAGASVYGAVQSSRAAKGAARSSKKAGKAFQQALQNIQVPKWDVGADIADAERITGYNINQLEQIYPGARSQREVASLAISDYMRGVIPQDVQQETMRNVAELAGAGFRPQAGPQAPGGFQAPQALLSRNLGLTSLNLQQAGMGLSMDWQKLAGAFIESPLQVGQARLNFEKAAADIQMGVAEGVYGSQMNTIGANLAARQAEIQGIQNIGQTIGSGISSVGTAINLRNIAQMAGQPAAGSETLSGRFQPFGEMASQEQFASGVRGYGLAGSVQNLFAGQLGQPARASMMPSGMLKSPY